MFSSSSANESWRLGQFEFLENEENDLSNNINQIIQNIEKKEWNKVKAIWTMKVLKMQPKMISPRSFNINTWGTENEMFIRCFAPLQEYKLV